MGPPDHFFHFIRLEVTKNSFAPHLPVLEIMGSPLITATFESKTGGHHLTMFFESLDFQRNVSINVLINLKNVNKCGGNVKLGVSTRRQADIFSITFKINYLCLNGHDSMILLPRWMK